MFRSNMSKLIRFTCQDDGIGFLTLANPPVNTLSSEMVSQLSEVINRITTDKDIRALIVMSAEKHFCVGLDLKEQSNISKEQSVADVDRMRDTYTQLSELSIPTICGVSGAALGGGAELALSCDFRILDESATIGFPEAQLGIIPGAGGTQRLPRLIGPSKAKYWIFSGKIFSSEEALDDGVADFLVDDGTVLESAIELAVELLTSGPIALKAAKYCIDSGLEVSIAEGLQIEQTHFSALVETEDRDEGLKAFLEKRDADWENK